MMNRCSLKMSWRVTKKMSTVLVSNVDHLQEIQDEDDSLHETFTSVALLKSSALHSVDLQKIQEEDDNNTLSLNTTSNSLLQPSREIILPSTLPPDESLTTSVDTSMNDSQTPPLSPISNSTPSIPNTASALLPPPGPILPDDAFLETPYDFFAHIFGRNTFQLIAIQTNLYALQKAKVKSFVGMIFAMGIHRVPALSNYWSQNPLIGVPGITKCMGRNKFKELLKNLHLNDNSEMPQAGTSEFDQLYKICPILETIRVNSQQSYRPNRELSVDEAMVLFKGRTSMKQYMPQKTVKRGYKVWCLCDAINGYVYNF